jgi:hypothetical protein
MFRDRRGKATAPIIPDVEPEFYFEEFSSVGTRLARLLTTASNELYTALLKSVKVYVYISKQSFAVTLHTSGKQTYGKVVDVFNKTYGQNKSSISQSIWCKVLQNTVIYEGDNKWTLDGLIDMVCKANVKLTFVAHDCPEETRLIPRVATLEILHIEKNNASANVPVPSLPEFSQLSIVQAKKCYQNFSKSEWSQSNLVSYGVLEIEPNVYRIVDSNAAKDLARSKYVLDPFTALEFKGLDIDSLYHHYAVTLKGIGDKKKVYKNVAEYVNKRSLDVRGIWYAGTDEKDNKSSIAVSLPVRYIFLKRY